MTVEEQVKAVQAQLTLLAAQNGELAARLTLQALQQGKDAELARLAATRDKDAATAEYARDKAQVQASFGTAHGLKEALANAMPAGREGSISVAKGGEGTQLMRAKAPMFKALDRIAACLVGRLPAATPRWVVATSAELEATMRAQAALAQLQHCAHVLAAGGGALPPAALVLPAALAALQSGMLALGAVSDAGRFFRVDRLASLFDAGDEAQRVFELLLLGRSRAGRPIERLAVSGLDLEAAAGAVYQRWAELDQAQRSATPAQAGAAHARTLLDLIDPASKPDAFWAVVVGAARAGRLAGAGRIEARASGQSVQVTERRFWRSDRLVSLGSAQVEYRVTDANGSLVASGVELDNGAALELTLIGGAAHLELPG